MVCLVDEAVVEFWPESKNCATKRTRLFPTYKSNFPRRLCPLCRHDSLVLYWPRSCEAAARSAPCVYVLRCSTGT